LEATLSSETSVLTTRLHIAEEDGLQVSIKFEVPVIIFPEMWRNELATENKLKAIMSISATAVRLTLSLIKGKVIKRSNIKQFTERNMDI
jgi:hypothetical protein